MITVSFAGTSLQTSNIVCTGIQHENVAQKSINVQKFALREGGKFTSVSFDVKRITLAGYIKGSSQSDLEGRTDDFKKLLNRLEQDLDIEYRGGIRRFKATMTSLLFDRQHWNLDYLPWEATFTISNPPLGKSIDTSTIEDLANTASGAVTATGEYDGYADYTGTFRPRPIIKITFNSVNGFRQMDFENVDDDGYFNRTRIQGVKLYDGDVITIDIERSEVALNGTPVDFMFGFPHFTLTGNTYKLRIVAQDYNADLKIIYTPLWL